MNTLNYHNYHTLFSDARSKLREQDTPVWQTTLLYSGSVYLLSALLSTLYLYFCTRESVGISSTLSIGRAISVISAISSVFSLFFVILAMCYKAFARDIIREKQSDIRTLAGYLRRWSTLFLTRVLVAIRYFLWTLAFILPSYLVMVFAVADIENPEALLEDQELMYETVTQHIRSSPLYPVILVLSCAALLGGFLMCYRYRLAVYFAAEDGWRARAAVQASGFAMRGHKLELLKLDLQLLWYHIPAFLPTAVLYGMNYLTEVSDTVYTIAQLIGYLWLFILEVLLMPVAECCYAGFAERVIPKKRADASAQELISEHAVP